MKIETLISADEIQGRIAELGKEIERDYGTKGEIVVVGVLKGAFMFMSDLVRHLNMPLRCDFLRVSSYDHDKNTGQVRMEFDLTQPIVGSDVLLVEDIVDSGNTLRYLLEHLHAKKPKSLKVASLLYKDTGKARKLVDYVCFNVPNKYVIGYGLDSEGLYRSLPFVGVFSK
ncbi:MAG: hypoxanthine phosphoribosyltransferase [Deltaproteobacteria bacterium]|nr:hypoxanthine phosphoribosyltransferase [Deltaproteobacteria bacterium]MBI2342456.1 hypoxanthine phosphoribosyltransferase [Deltaproteobacteria bacterium]